MYKNGSESALLCVDLNERDCEIYKDTMRFIEGELSYFRERSRQIFFLTNKIENRFKPRLGEVVIFSQRPNGFFETNLLQDLLSKKIGKITIIGANPLTKILLTAATALDYGFNVVVPEALILGTDDEIKIVNQLIEMWQKIKNES